MLCLAVASVSCGGAQPGAESLSEETTIPDTSVVEREAESPRIEDPFYGFDIDRPSTESRQEKLLALRLENSGAGDAVVFADAGAGEVFLDSVASGSWSRVDLVTQGPAVTLRTARSTGETIQHLDLAVVPDSVIDVLLGDPAAGP